MSEMATSYWYDVATGRVLSADARDSDVWLGPFSTAAEAEEAPQTFIAHASAWLNSEQGQHYLALAKQEYGDLDGLDGLDGLDSLDGLGGLGINS